MKKALLAVTGLFLVAVLNAQSLEEIVNRYTKANKFDQLSKLSSIKITAKMSMASMNLTLPMEVWMKNPDKIKQVTDFNGQKIISAFNGTKGYSINPMGGSEKPVDMSADEIKQARNNIMFKNILQESLKAGKLTLLGVENVKEKPAFKVKADLDGIPVVLYIDKESYLVSKQTTTVSQGGMETTVDSYPSDYKEVNGIILPMKTTSSTQGIDVMMTYEKVEVNIPMEDSIFTLN
ncbi:MAG TPA: hypothetical protein VHO50_11850 [Bacteroidales bacterium]|nr:hypothetical protein [Bacteroidales bacterium]